MDRCAEIFDTAFALVDCQLESGHKGRHLHQDQYAVIIWYFGEKGRSFHDESRAVRP